MKDRLSPEEATRLANLLPNDDARRELVIGCTWMCEYAARWGTSRVPSASFDDLKQEAVIGVLRACKKWDGSKGAEFTTYCYFWVRQAVVHAIRKSVGIIRIPEKISLDRLGSLSKDQFHAMRVAREFSPYRVYLHPRCIYGSNPLHAVDAKLDLPVIMRGVPERDAFILRERSEGASLQQLGDALGITRERVRQLEARILRKIRSHYEELCCHPA